MELSSSDRRVRIARPVRWNAAAIGRLRIRVRSDSLRRAVLFWGGPDQGPSESRRIRIPAASDAAEAEDLFFDLRDHPQWQGSIRRIFLDFIGDPPLRVEVHEVAAELRSLPSAEVERIASRPWKVELDHSVRGAIAIPAGSTRTWTLERPAAGATLRASVGAVNIPGTGLRARIVGWSGDAPPRVLYERKIGARKIGSSTLPWKPIEIPIAAGTVDSLRFETETAGESAGSAIVLWANPTLVPQAPASDLLPNVVLISLDTLRADRLSLYGHSVDTSPNLDRWARDSAVTFDHAVASSPRTLPSHASILTGMNPIRHGVNYHFPIPESMDLLPELLRPAGYHTLAVLGGGLMHPRFGVGQGFDELRYWPGWAGGSDELEDGLERALEMLERHRGLPTLLFFHTYEIHDPYLVREPWSDSCPPAAEDDSRLLYGARPLERTEARGFRLDYEFIKWRQGQGIARAKPAGPEELARIRCLYDAGISYTDHQLQRLLDAAEASPRPTLIVVTSDHGESLGENGQAKHAYLDDTNLAVPLVVALPDRRHAGKRVPEQVSSVDVLPTILDALGLPIPAEVDGESLLPLVDGSARQGGRREAWSYAAHENRGVSLWLDGRVQFLYDDTAWAPAEDRGRLRVPGDPSAPPSPSSLDKLEDRVVTALERESPTFRLQISNRTCARLEVTLLGKGVSETEVKIASREAQAVRWLRPGAASLSLGPETLITVFLAHRRGALVTEAQASGCSAVADAAISHRLELDAPVQQVLSLTAAGWSSQAVAAAERSASISFLAPALVAGEDVEDPAVREQLEALGYL